MRTQQQKAWDKMRREERKQIEQQLHPNPTVNGFEIAHSHERNGKIIFQAYDKEGLTINNRYLSVYRSNVLKHTKPKSFYKTYKKDIEWLTLQEAPC